MPESVLITGARAPVAIDLARAFKSAGFDVYLADSIRCWAAKCSSAKTGRVHKFPPPRYAFEEFAENLDALVKSLNPRLVIPTCEEVFYVAAAAEKYGFLDRVFAPSLNTLDKLHSKIMFAEHAKTLGLDVPKTWTVKNKTEALNLPLSAQDYVYKPEYSRFASQTLIKPDADVLEKLIFQQGQKWAVQEFIEGKEICLWVAAVKGTIVANAAYRPKWRFGKSASYAFEHIEHAKALNVAKKIAAADNITGHLSFDIILTPDGRAVPIECNPRAISGLHLFDARAELARAIVDAKPMATPPANLRYLSMAMVMLGFPSAIKSGKFRAYRQDWKRGRDVLGRPGDRLPVAGALLDAGKFVWMGLKQKRSSVAETTDDIEWNGESLL